MKDKIIFVMRKDYEIPDEPKIVLDEEKEKAFKQVYETFGGMIPIVSLKKIFRVVYHFKG